MKPELIEKVEKLLGLSPATDLELSYLKKDPEVTAQAAVMKDFMTAVNEFGNSELKKQMQEWDEENEDSQQEGHRAPMGDDDPASIPHAVLEQYFAPNPSYEVNIGAAMRGSSPVLEVPPNEFDWDEPTRLFKFNAALKEGTRYRIENNRSDVLQEGSMDAQKEVSIDFPVSKMLPGRYYLKIYDSKDTRFVAFFVRRDLLNKK